MDRRSLIVGLTAGIATTLSACSSSDGVRPTPSESATPTSAVTPSATSTPTEVEKYSRKKLGKTAITEIPKGDTRQIALTIDDGVSPEVVEGYCKIAKETGLRLTFFANGCYSSWKDNKKLLAPLVDSGQVVMGNHTYDHPSLTTLSDAGIVKQMSDNDKVFRKLFGKTTKPFMRPPYGYYNNHVGDVLRKEGYRGVIMWYGNIGDDQDISPKELMANAKTWFKPGKLVIGHANHPAVTHCYDKLVKLMEDRDLTSVTMADVYY